MKLTLEAIEKARTEGLPALILVAEQEKLLGGLPKDRSGHQARVAAAGQLNILAAGPGAVLAAAQPYLDLMGRRTWRFGEAPPVANAVKAAVNYNIIHAMQALAGF